MNTGTTIQILKLLCLVVIASLGREAVANSGTISCGTPAQNGFVTVIVRLSGRGKPVVWTARILKGDTPSEKANKIRAAAPASHAKLETDAGSNTIAGGTANVVRVTSKPRRRIKAMGFIADTTNEREVVNQFALLLSDHRGLVSLAGVATGLDSNGGPALVSVTASGVTAQVNTAAEMSAEAIEGEIIEQLAAGGVSASLADADFIADSFLGLEGDGRLVIIDDIDATGLETNNTDVGITVDVSGLIDVSVEPIPTLTEWGLIVMALLLVSAGAIVIWQRRQVTA